MFCWVEVEQAVWNSAQGTWWSLLLFSVLPPHHHQLQPPASRRRKAGDWTLGACTWQPRAQQGKAPDSIPRHQAFPSMSSLLDQSRLPASAPFPLLLASLALSGGWRTRSWASRPPSGRWCDWPGRLIGNFSIAIPPAAVQRSSPRLQHGSWLSHRPPFC